jgi:mono/diheme cytochrome c family protein
MRLMNCRTRCLSLFAGLLVLAGCGGSAPAAESSGSSTETVTVGADGQMRVDLDAIFPAGQGRDLLLNNCQSCHTWVPVVVLQMNEEEWNRWAVEHRGRVGALTDDEFSTLHAYLIRNFNPSTPVPELPPAMLEAWTTY